MSGLRAIPTTYAGVRFRSRLEAHWALNLDAWGIRWQYEPEGYDLPSGARYLPDFWLPRIKTWLEIKGPSGDRLDKVEEFADAVQWVGDIRKTPSRCHQSGTMVVVGEAPINGHAAFRSAGGLEVNQLMLHKCGQYSFFDGLMGWACTACDEGGKVYNDATMYTSALPDADCCFGAGFQMMPFRTVQWQHPSKASRSNPFDTRRPT